MLKLTRLLREQKGQVLILFVGALTALLGIAALVVDGGYMYLTKTQLQNEADAAALAGASAKLSTTVASDYVVLNGNDTLINKTPFVSGNDIKVDVSRDINLFFAPVVGMKNPQTITATATARYNNGISGLRPWALDKDFVRSYGQQMILKEGGGDGTNGFYGVIGFGDQNANAASTYSDNVKYGYDPIVSIGDYVQTGQGNDNNVKNYITALIAAYHGDYTTVQIGNPRIIIIPIIDTSTLKITGFAALYIESYSNKGGITFRFLNDSMDSGQGNWGQKLSLSQLTK